MDDELFAIWIFFEDDWHFKEAEGLDARSAVQLAREITLRPAATHGFIKRVIITDGGDCIAFEWEHGKGVTYPDYNQPTKLTNND